MPLQAPPETFVIAGNPRREGRLSGMRAELLFSRADRDGLSPRLELDYFGHRLVSRSRVAFLLIVLHRLNNFQTVALFQLNCYGLERRLMG